MHHRAVVWMVACLALAPASGVAQRGSEARLILSLNAGATVSQPTLWAISRQPLLVPIAPTPSPPLYDTVSLSRGFVTNLIVGVTGTYFPKPAVAIEISATWLGLTVETSCRGVSFDSVLSTTNRDMCAAIQGSTRSLGAIAFSAGGLARASPRGPISPYARAGVGLTFSSISTMYIEGPTPSGIKVVVDDPSPRLVSVALAVGAGATVGLGPGYQFRLEVGDAVMRFEGPTGPANGLAQAPRGSHFTHHVTFTMGLGIVLQAKPGRRY